MVFPKNPLPGQLISVTLGLIMHHIWVIRFVWFGLLGIKSLSVYSQRNFY
jgi:hypothetical protein